MRSCAFARPLAVDERNFGRCLRCGQCVHDPVGHLAVERVTEPAPPSPARPRDLPAGRANLCGSRRRAAVPAGRLGDRRPSGHPSARRSWRRRRPARHGGLGLRVPRLRHDRLRRPPARRGRPALRTGPGRRRSVARRDHRGRRRGPAGDRDRPAGQRARRLSRGHAVRRHLPARVRRRRPGDARRPRRHRRAARPAGHPDPARGRDRGGAGQHRAQPPARLRRGARHRRLGAGHGAGPVGDGARARRRRAARGEDVRRHGPATSGRDPGGGGSSAYPCSCAP